MKYKKNKKVFNSVNSYSFYKTKELRVKDGSWRVEGEWRQGRMKGNIMLDNGCTSLFGSPFGDFVYYILSGNNKVV